MAKYTDEQIGIMAREVLKAKENNDMEYSELVLILTLSTSMKPDEVHEKIQYMADNY